MVGENYEYSFVSSIFIAEIVDNNAEVIRKTRSIFFTFNVTQWTLVYRVIKTIT